MTEAVEELKSLLESLTSRERAELAQFLIRSLDQNRTTVPNLYGILN